MTSKKQGDELFRMDESGLAFSRDGLALTGGLPGVVLLVGAEEREMTWTAPGTHAGRSHMRQTPLGVADESVMSWSFGDGLRLDWHITQLRRWPGFTLRTSLHNESAVPVRLRTLGVLQAGAPALKTDHEEWFAMAPFAGRPIAGEGLLSKAAGGERSFPDCASLYSQQGERGVFMVPVGPAESHVTFSMRTSNDGLGLSVNSEMTDIVVDPGESRTSEEVLFLFAPHRESYEAALRWIGVTHGTRTNRGPLTGWCSWYDKHSAITGAHMLAVCKALKETREVVPHDVIQIDEGYQQHWGDWRTNEKFPDGWKPVVDAIKEAGATPGLWLAPLGVHDATGVIAQHPEWFQIRSGTFERPYTVWGPSGMLHYLDPTHPEAQQFIRQIIRAALAEGFRYFKIDFNNTAENACYYDVKATRFQARRRLYQLYREEMGAEVYLNACIINTMDRAAVGLADAMRIGNDSDYNWDWIMQAMCATAHSAPVNGVLLACDPDVFYTRKHKESLTDDQLRSWQGFVGLLGGLVMTSDPFHEPAFAATLRELEICSPPVRERTHALLSGMEIQPSLFGFVTERAWGSFAAVQLFNAKEVEGDVVLDAPELRELGQCHLWSFRDEAYLGTVSSGYQERCLPAWGSRLVRLTPVASDGKPQLIGSSLHIGMGAVEVTDWKMSADTLEIELNDGGARNGALYISSEKPLALERVLYCVATLEAVSPTIWCLRLKDRVRGKGQILKCAVGREIRTVATESESGRQRVALSLNPHTDMQFDMQGSASSSGRMELTVTNPNDVPASGEVQLVANSGAATISPASIKYHLKPGVSEMYALVLNPLRHQGTGAVIRASALRPAAGLVVQVCPMHPLSLRIPGAGDEWNTLRGAAEAMSALALPGQPVVAQVRLAASERQLFVTLAVQDPWPAPNPVKFWQGSCVELFVAASNAPVDKLSQFFFHPTPALDQVCTLRAVPGGGVPPEPFAGVRTDFQRTTEGYTLSFAMPFASLGLPAAAKEFLLDMQVSRKVKDVIENFPLFGATGPNTSSRHYARITVEKNI